ncbi:hypothetical protein RC86_14010 [Pectobacterium brasiliense]|uniref:DUF4062 domain-containing protein n=1 Tax=Pectobacterium brasiliense TaxID=180957 RepID=UPI00057D4EC2|nr:DUF4062 domain-containing protein [Pectobacterium brasiliense]KHS90093.1 hypothetical protein RC86_14010 [Pectobacterium brasiliense]KHT21573.1 hypothetical protein RC95_10045 [Pectobacterium brasiliense]
MDKRYQVFVSSTFTDLEEERKHVIQTLMEMDCIPAGMELFPAIDETQWEFIKKVIDDCDYYLLIIGGRYGSTADDGLSYTEKEFDYAVSKGIKVIILIHEDPNSLPMNKTELNPDSRKKLLLFIDKVQKGRLRKTWKSVQELPGLVALSMTKTIKTYPATGWIRADKISNESDLRNLIELQKEVEELRKTIADSSTESELSYTGKIADFDSVFDLNYKVHSAFDEWEDSRDCKLSWSWRQFFHFISPYVFKGINHDELFESIRIKLDNEVTSDNYVSLNESDLQTIELQFIALGLITFDHEKWTLTNKGKKMMMEVRTIK